MSRKLAFIGGGNMAEGIIRGMVGSGAFQPEEISVFDIIPARVAFLADTYKIQPSSTTEAAAQDADVVVFAVRPQNAEETCEQVKPFLKQECVFVSICAGVKIESFEKWLGEDKKIVRVMPNTLTQTKHGYTAVCLNENTSKEDAAVVISMMEAIGQVMQISESMFDNFTAYSCAGPAYLLFLMNALIDAGVRTGFSRKDARAITIENMIGTAMKTDQMGAHPFEILDTMTSPGGVGIEGIYTMMQEGVYGGVMHSVEQAAEKSKGLG